MLNMYSLPYQPDKELCDIYPTFWCMYCVMYTPYVYVGTVYRATKSISDEQHKQCMESDKDGLQCVADRSWKEGQHLAGRR